MFGKFTSWFLLIKCRLKGGCRLDSPPYKTVFLIVEYFRFIRILSSASCGRGSAGRG
jgi:hypothetical protein